LVLQLLAGVAVHNVVWMAGNASGLCGIYYAVLPSFTWLAQCAFRGPCDDVACCLFTNHVDIWPEFLSEISNRLHCWLENATNLYHCVFMSTTFL